MMSRGIYDSPSFRRSWHSCIQSVFAIVEFTIIFALILVSLIAMVPGLCVREGARRRPGL